VSGFSLRHVSGRQYRLAVMALFGLILVWAGGASRYDEDQQMLVRLAAIAAIVASLWPLETGALRRYHRSIGGMALLYVILLLQLVPLPPGLWAQLPGHAVYARIAEAAGVVQWRPISLTPDLTVNALLALLPVTAAVLGALYLDPPGRRLVAQWIVAAACCSGVLGLIQLGIGGGVLHFYRESSADSAIGLFANRNHQAALLACALPLTGAVVGLGVRDSRDHRIVLVIGASAIGLLLLALVSTGSRMGLVLGVLGLLGAGWCYRASGQPILPARPAARIAAALVSAGMVTAIALAAIRGGAIGRLAVIDTASETRAEMLGPLFAMARTFMPLGAGFGSFDSVYRQFEPDALLSTIYMNQAHNEPMQLAIEGGVPALLLLGLFLCWWTMAALRVVRADVPFKRRTMGIAAVVVTAILMMSSLVDYPLRTPLLGAVFAIACVEMMRTTGPREMRAGDAA
jgi:hypothetical protein